MSHEMCLNHKKKKTAAQIVVSIFRDKTFYLLLSNGYYIHMWLWQLLRRKAWWLFPSSLWLSHTNSMTWAPVHVNLCASCIQAIIIFTKNVFFTCGSTWIQESYHNNNFENWNVGRKHFASHCGRQKHVWRGRSERSSLTVWAVGTSGVVMVVVNTGFICCSTVLTYETWLSPDGAIAKVQFLEQVGQVTTSAFPTWLAFEWLSPLGLCFP